MNIKLIGIGHILQEQQESGEKIHIAVPFQAGPPSTDYMIFLNSNFELVDPTRNSIIQKLQKLSTLLETDFGQFLEFLSDHLIQVRGDYYEINDRFLELNQEIPAELKPYADYTFEYVFDSDAIIEIQKFLQRHQEYKSLLDRDWETDH